MFGLTQYFTVYDVWSPLFVVVSVGIIILYLGVTGPFRHHFAGSRPVSWLQKWLFIAGVFLFYLAQGGPINMMGHMMFTFHMVMMAVSYMIVPPILLFSIPDWIWRYLLKRKLFQRWKKWTHPIWSAVLFNVLFSFYHVPVVHNYVMKQYAVHIFYYVILFIASLSMWWWVITPVPEWTRFADVKKMGYIFLNGLLITPACALIIFASDPLFATYVDKEAWIQAMGYCISGDPAVMLAMFEGPAFFNWFSPLEDQQLGGIVMKLVQEMMYGAILGYVFVHWFRREGKDDDDRELT